MRWSSLAAVVVVLTGAYFVALATLAWRAPSRAGQFLLGFARSASTHYAELAIRAVVGIAFVWAAPTLRGAVVFRTFSWVLLVTTAGLALVPWETHRRFARWAVPRALEHLPLIGAAALAVGALVLAAVFERALRLPASSEVGRRRTCPACSPSPACAGTRSSCGTPRTPRPRSRMPRAPEAAAAAAG